MIVGRTAYARALAAFDPALIVASMSAEVVIRVAVHDEPLRGTDTARFLFGVLTQELVPFELVDENRGGGKSVVMFETSLRGHRAHGLNVVACDSHGLVSELAVFFRPLAVLELIANVIGGHMSECFGPPEA